MLPKAALEISKLLSNPSSGANDFAQVLLADPALSVDVLRIANSAFYGFGKVTENVRDAVVRIGLNQLRGLVIVTHLNGKVLQGGAFKREAGWLSDLSLALAHLAQYVAGPLGLKPDNAFTRGMLMHVEHFVIMGTVNEMSKDQKRKVDPSSTGLSEAILRCGGMVRELAAREWGLEDLLLEEEGSVGSDDRFSELRKALVADWTGQVPMPDIQGVPPGHLSKSLEKVRNPGVVAAGDD